MTSRIWHIPWATTGRRTGEAWHSAWSDAFYPSREDMVKRFETANRTTPVRLFVSAVSAPVIYNVSSLSLFVIVCWILALIAVDLLCFALRKMIIDRPASNLDYPVFIVANIALCGAWCAMPLVLEFRSQMEVIAGLVALMGTLISALVATSQAQIWLLYLLVAGGAMLAPDVANLFSYKPHAATIGVLTIKILFLLNFTSLARDWHLSAARKARMRAELKKARQEAEDLAAAKAKFLAHMSHEIRSPLAGVTLMASLLKRLDDVPENRRNLIDQIDAGGQAILNLLNTVLDYSKIEARKVTLSPAPTDVHALLNGIVRLFQRGAQEANIGLQISIDGPLPSALVLDETRVRQILTNLIGNAVKHSASTAIYVFARYEDINEILFLEVIDRGRGLDEETKRRLFKPHEQRSSADSGTGLGLAISQGLIDLMGGKIGFHDTPGGGATFWARIPAPHASNVFSFVVA